ncbi:aspartyl-phosphate phosphatase Spo0E family protein [Bacillus dakarensis]|uniref:aspartyl-phosphate phosphatase Spo0E family protein n=1 Tax=Robertmurraya dakarensis TaxID=1926278 RepID=UPI0009FD388C|nr:aspartyl-phosphate phosphatase Spo0E family protein [Bacillus dakarensis]
MDDKNLHILGPFSLRLYIEYLRNELIQTGQKLGFNHKLTIQASEELDYFLNVYEKTKR